MKIPQDLSRLPSAELLALYGRIQDELRYRGMERAGTGFLTGYSRDLTVRALDLRLPPEPDAAYDAVGRDGSRFLIRARRRIPGKRSTRQLGTIRAIPGDDFDVVVGILFRPDYSVERGCVVPADVVRMEGTHQTRTGHWILRLYDRVWEADGVRDVTAVLRSAAGA